MSLVVALSRGLAGVDAPLVTVEVHLSGGLPAFNLVGLPEAEVRESRDRVHAALQNANFDFPPRDHGQLCAGGLDGLCSRQQAP